jgi:hypothetical protein
MSVSARAAEFRASPPFNSFRFRVECRCGGKSVAPAEWPSLLQSCAVVVLTPEIFRGLLSKGSARFDQLDLLVRGCQQSKAAAEQTSCSGQPHALQPQPFSSQRPSPPADPGRVPQCHRQRAHG